MTKFAEEERHKVITMTITNIPIQLVKSVPSGRKFRYANGIHGNGPDLWPRKMSLQDVVEAIWLKIRPKQSNTTLSTPFLRDMLVTRLDT